jgi:general secretion pathway protein K
MTEMPPTAAQIDRSSSDGFILVAVLWILGGLSVLAAVYALYVVNAAAALGVNDDRIQANASVSAALEMTAYYLGAEKKQDRSTHGAFNFRTGNSSVAVEFLSEDARVDLNEAPKPILAGLLRALGAPADAADYDADRIVGWRTVTTAPNPDQDKEVMAYRNAGLPYTPRQAPFTNVQELWLVLGLPPALVERAMPFVTVFSGMPTIGVMSAAPEVVAALPGMTPDRLNTVLDQRNAAGADPAQVLALLGPAQASATAQPSNATRVTVQVSLVNGRRINAQAVILLLEDAADPYRVLSWTDDFDG